MNILSTQKYTIYYTIYIHIHMYIALAKSSVESNLSEVDEEPTSSLLINMQDKKHFWPQSYERSYGGCLGSDISATTHPKRLEFSYNKI